MSRLFRSVLPHPLLSILVAIVWCMLINEIKLGTFVFAAILGIFIPIATARYWPDRPRSPRKRKLLAYAGLVIWDILVANIQVAIIVLFRPNREMRSQWVVIPLDLRTPEAITLFAATITLTPGTVSADFSNKGHYLLVHVLDTSDPEEAVAQMKDRYERRLKEIFE